MGVTMAEVQRDHFRKTWAALGGNTTRVAAALGVSVKTVYNWRRKWGPPVGVSPAVTMAARCRFCGGTGAEPLPGGVAFVACRDGCRGSATAQGAS
jgi:hypothetical protein